MFISSCDPHTWSARCLDDVWIYDSCLYAFPGPKHLENQCMCRVYWEELYSSQGKWVHILGAQFYHFSSLFNRDCTTVHRYPIFSTIYSVMCMVYTGYCGTSEIEHGLCACTVDNPLAKARGLSLRTGAQTMLYLSLKFSKTEMLLQELILSFLRRPL